MKLAINAKLYRNTGSFVIPVWDEIPGVHDVTLDVPFDEADVSARGGGGFRQTEPTLLDAGLEFDMPWEETDLDLTALRTAAFARTSIEMLALDGLVTVAGSQGLRSTMKIFQFTREEGLEEALRAQVRMKPCYSTNPSSWFTAP